MTIDYKPIRMKRIYEIVADLIKSKVFSGEYKVGDRLPTAGDLAEMIGVSRNAVQHAYHVLELSGGVEIRKGPEGGAFISDPSHKPIIRSISDLLFLRKITLEDITEARLMLEKGLAELVIERFKQEDIRELEAWIDKAFNKLEQGIPSYEENIHFHIRLFQTAHNPLMSMVYSSVMELLLLTLKILPADFAASRKVAEEHRCIITLLKEKRLEELSELLVRHIHEANKRLLAKTRKVNGSPSTLLSNDVSDLTKSLIRTA